MSIDVSRWATRADNGRTGIFKVDVKKQGGMSYFRCFDNKGIRLLLFWCILIN